MSRETAAVPDDRRVQWYREVLAEVACAIANGARARTFHAWSLLDKLQWAEAYTGLHPIGSACEAGRLDNGKVELQLLAADFCPPKTQSVALPLQKRKANNRAVCTLNIIAIMCPV